MQPPDLGGGGGRTEGNRTATTLDYFWFVSGVSHDSYAAQAEHNVTVRESAAEPIERPHCIIGGVQSESAHHKHMNHSKVSAEGKDLNTSMSNEPEIKVLFLLLFQITNQGRKWKIEILFHLNDPS